MTEPFDPFLHQAVRYNCPSLHSRFNKNITFKIDSVCGIRGNTQRIFERNPCNIKQISNNNNLLNRICNNSTLFVINNFKHFNKYCFISQLNEPNFQTSCLKILKTIPFNQNIWNMPYNCFSYGSSIYDKAIKICVSKLSNIFDFNYDTIEQNYSCKEYPIISNLLGNKECNTQTFSINVTETFGVFVNFAGILSCRTYFESLISNGNKICNEYKVTNNFSYTFKNRICHTIFPTSLTWKKEKCPTLSFALAPILRFGRVSGGTGGIPGIKISGRIGGNS